MMNVHKFMNTTTFFTYSLSPITDYFFNSCPSITICFMSITTIPIWMIFAMRTILCPPISRTPMRTKMFFLCFEISRRTLKFFLTPSAYFFSSIAWACSSCWTFMVTLHRAVFSCIAFKINRFFSTNKTFYNNASFKFICSSALSILIKRFHSYSITYNGEIDKDYFNAAKKRLENHQKQGLLF